MSKPHFYIYTARGPHYYRNRWILHDGGHRVNLSLYYVLLALTAVIIVAVVIVAVTID